MFMSSIKVRKVGNSLGVILPKEVQETLNVSEGDMIDFSTTEDNKVVIGAFLPHHSKWQFKNSGELSKEDQEWLEADLEDEELPK